MRVQYVGIACLLPAIIMMQLGCSQQSTANSPDPLTMLQAIPAARPAEYGKIRDMKAWRNPYLIVRSDGVTLLDAADNAEIMVKTDDLLGMLAHLKASDWPYGRVVAVHPGAHASEQEAVAIRRNKGIIGGMLQGARIDIRWVPAT